MNGTSANQSESQGMAKKTTSLRVEEDLWKEAKKHCIDEDISLSEYIEELVQSDLEVGDTSE